MSPRGFFRGLWRWSVVIVVILALGVLASVAAWRGWWWFANNGATLQNQQIQNGVSNQESLAGQVRAKLADVTAETVQIAAHPDLAAALKAQRAAEAGEACADASQITGVQLAAPIITWVDRNCSLGALSPTSPLYVNGAP